MRKTALCVALLSTFAVARLSAQGRGGQAKTTHGPQLAKTTVTSGTATHGRPQTSQRTAPANGTHGKSGTTTKPTAATTSTNVHAGRPGGKTTTTSNVTGKSARTTITATGKRDSTKVTADTTPVAATTPPTTTANPIAAKIESHPKLATRITNMLPPDLTLASASSGFRNQGQFLAAVHVSRNLNIPFADLKAAMVGTIARPAGTTTTPTTTATPTTTTAPLSLGQAIKKLRPTTDVAVATQLATTQASADVNTTTVAAPKKRGH